MSNTLARRLIDFLGGLTLSDGDHDGEPFTILPWERQVRPGGVQGAGAGGDCPSARGNGKSALVAGIATAVADPGRAAEWPAPGGCMRGVELLRSKPRSSLRTCLRSCVSGTTSATGRLWRLQDSANRAVGGTHRPTGARVRCVGSDPKPRLTGSGRLPGAAR